MIGSIDCWSVRELFTHVRNVDGASKRASSVMFDKQL